MPIIADVDGDYRTEIVTTSNLNCSVSCPTLDPIHSGLRCDEDAQCTSGACVGGLCRCTSNDECSAGTLCSAMLQDDGQGQVCRSAHTGKKQGIQVFSDYKDSWVYSRPIWNQHAYSVTNVNDDGTIPPRDQVVKNWTVPQMNHFRQNAQGAANPVLAADLTVESVAEPVCDGDAAGWQVEVCNRGALPVSEGIEVTLTLGDLEHILVTTVALLPGECELLEQTLALPNANWSGTFFFTVDTAGGGAVFECIEGNNETTPALLNCQE